MSELLLEIGSEELPAEYVADALLQLQSSLLELLKSAGLFENSAVRTLGTPRRLVAIAESLKASQDDKNVILRGPSLAAAYDAAGKPTKALLGFAGKQRVPIDLIETDSTGQYCQVRVSKPGQPATAVLAKALPSVVASLTFPKSMRWGTEKMRFARPIRWIAALLDSDVINFDIGPIKSGRLSRGHRFLSPSEFEISNAGEYASLVRNAKVILDADERRQMIVDQANSLAMDAGGRAVLSSALLEENVYLTEFPTVVLGEFANEYLELPRPVLTTAMAKHQRYFPVEAPDGKLMPRFLAVRNGGERALDTVRAGYQHVLAARFNDARYFFEQDAKKLLIDTAEQTAKIVFQDKLGSIADKTQRIVNVLDAVLPASLVENREALIRAAQLCKADLASMMVVELPSLQGVIGAEYALRDGEPEEVAVAIREHYLPKGAGDALPSTLLGSCLAIIDRMDTLTGYMALGFAPTGTSDPYGLKRAATAVSLLLEKFDVFRGISDLVRCAYDQYLLQNTDLELSLSDVVGSVHSLVAQRLDAIMDERGVEYDVRHAVIKSGIDRVPAVFARSSAIGAASGSPELTDATAVATRVGNILRSVDISQVDVEDAAIDPTLFAEDAEKALYSCFRHLHPDLNSAASSGDWSRFLKLASRLRGPVDIFFDNVRVMSEDPAVRTNRLLLLVEIERAIRQIAHLETLVTS